MTARLLRGRWAPAVLWAVTLVVLTSWPNPGVPQVGHGDKVVHALLYGILAWLVARAEPGWLTPARALAALSGIAAFAAADEWHQAYVPGRSASEDDWAADVVGAALALLLAAVRRRRAASA